MLNRFLLLALFWIYPLVSYSPQMITLPGRILAKEAHIQNHFLYFPNHQNLSRRDTTTWKNLNRMKEQQLTFDKKGHLLHNTQVFSPDDQWIVYDTRNVETEISENCCIEMVNVKTGETRLLYQTKHQSIYGPGVAAATFSPVENEVLFIHGLSNCDSSRPYSQTRRTGVAVKITRPGIPIYKDARDLQPPFTPGALRGGTHAHTWSGDGQWISFTYNDAIMAELEKKHKEVRDMRMVGIMAPYGPVKVNKDTAGENKNGEMFTVVVSRVTEDPKPGSNEIEKAHGDCWVGKDGYIRTNGERQKRAVAFLGDTRDKANHPLTEVYIADIPDDVTHASPGAPIEGTAQTRPLPPKGVKQRRLTYTANRKYPGIEGPRFWIRCAPDGSLIFFLMKDDRGIVQFYAVSPNGGPIKQITHNDFSVSGTFNVSPDGKFLAYAGGNNVYVTEIATGITKNMSPDNENHPGRVQWVNWSNNGKMIAYDRKVATEGKDYYQIFILKTEE